MVGRKRLVGRSCGFMILGVPSERMVNFSGLSMDALLKFFDFKNLWIDPINTKSYPPFPPKVERSLRILLGARMTWGLFFLQVLPQFHDR